MTEMMVKIMVGVLDILGTATNEQSRWSEVDLRLRFLETHLCREIFQEGGGNNEAGGWSEKLDKMTNEEARMTNVEVLRVTHIIKENVEGVDQNVKMVNEKVQIVIDGAQTMLS
jgi:hypothetical protein